jgi:hypothetical protein
MEITFNLTPEQQTADDQRRAAWDREQRQHTRAMTPAEYAAARSVATKPARPAPIAAGASVRDMSDAEYQAELRRIGARRPRRSSY